MLEKKLEERRLADKYRTLSHNGNGTDFLSNDYLGLSRSQELFGLIEKKVSHHNLGTKKNGSTGSRLLSGNDLYISELEEKFSKFFDAPACLIFNSGYNANLSILSCVPQKADTIIHDELIHASLIDGARLSYAKRLSFKHNDISDLEKKLRLAQGEKYVVVESVYSMDGDESPIEDLITLCKIFDAKLIVDEAHSTGIWGLNGNGWLCEKKLHSAIFARIYTFGKAMGVHGACICGSTLLKDYLINFARPFIYTTALPLSHYIAMESSFEFLQTHLSLRNQLFENIHFFKNTFEQIRPDSKNLLLPSNSAIQIINIVGNKNAKIISQKLNESGYEIRAILSPTVPEGKERLRICLHSYNTKTQIIGLIKQIDLLLNTYDFTLSK